MIAAALATVARAYVPVSSLTNAGAWRAFGGRRGTAPSSSVRVSSGQPSCRGAPPGPLLAATVETPDWFSGFRKSSRAADFAAAVSAIDTEGKSVLDLCKPLRAAAFFRLYSVDMMASCGYFPQEIEPCGLELCECYPIDEREVPASVSGPDFDEYEFELDGWARWDMPTEDYYDIVQYPEANTQYDGQAIWTFIHERICFNARGNAPETEWQRDFDRAVSGLHTSVSAHIILSMLEDERRGEVALGLDGEPTDAAAQYTRRIREQPGAVENLYFAYMLLLSAVHEASERLSLIDYGDDVDELSLKVRALLQAPLLANPGVTGAADNLRAHASTQGGMGLWQARLRARDMLRVMNCVQCSACRLHGKVAALGLASGLQLLIGGDGNNDAARMHRVEVAALVTALSKFGKAITIVSEFEAEIASRSKN